MPEKIISITLVTSTPRFSQDLAPASEWRHAMSDEVLNRFADNLKQDTEKTLKGFIALQFIGVKDAKAAQNELIDHILYNKQSNNKSQQMLNKWGGVCLDDALVDEDIEQNEKTDSENNIPTQEALAVGLSILKHADLRKTQSSCPQHWIFAEYDRLIPKEVINDLISLRPDAEITLLKKAGHAPFITHPDAFLQDTINFIESID